MEKLPLLSLKNSRLAPTPSLQLPLWLTVGWYFSQFSHQACVFCSKQMLLFRIWANS